MSVTQGENMVTVMAKPGTIGDGPVQLFLYANRGFQRSLTHLQLLSEPLHSGQAIYQEDTGVLQLRVGSLKSASMRTCATALAAWDGSLLSTQNQSDRG